jgi:hypothetical protein
VVDAQLLHESGPVGFDSLDTDGQVLGDSRFRERQVHSEALLRPVRCEPAEGRRRTLQVSDRSIAVRQVAPSKYPRRRRTSLRRLLCFFSGLWRSESKAVR